jgi:hypothetical protein
MPVIPLGVKPYSIHPPCTMGDNGTPSSSLLKDIQRVLHMIDDERHLTAHTLFCTIQTRIEQFETDNHNNSTTSSGIQQPKLKTKGSFLFTKRGGGGGGDKSQAGIDKAAMEERDMIQQVKVVLEKKKEVFEKLEVT